MVSAVHKKGMSTQISNEAATARENSRGAGGKFGAQVHSESPTVTLGGDPWGEHSDAVEDAASRTGIRDGHAYTYKSSSLQANAAGQLELAINLADDDGDSAQLVHNYARDTTTYKSRSLSIETEDTELVETVVNDVCPEYEGNPSGVFERFSHEAKVSPGIHPKVDSLLNSRSKTEPRQLNTRASKVGDKLVITQDGKDLEMTVARIDPPGTFGTSYADGPHIAAHIRPGGYAVNLDDSNIGKYQARTASDL